MEGGWPQLGISPNSFGVMSHFDDVRSESCCSETLKGRHCFPLRLLPTVCLPLLFSLFQLSSEWRFSLRHTELVKKKTLPPSHHDPAALCIATNYIPPPLFLPATVYFNLSLQSEWWQLEDLWAQIRLKPNTVQDGSYEWKDVNIRLTDKIGDVNRRLAKIYGE